MLSHKQLCLLLSPTEFLTWKFQVSNWAKSRKAVQVLKNNNNSWLYLVFSTPEKAGEVWGVCGDRWVGRRQSDKSYRSSPIINKNSMNSASDIHLCHKISIANFIFTTTQWGKEWRNILLFAHRDQLFTVPLRFDGSLPGCSLLTGDWGSRFNSPRCKLVKSEECWRDVSLIMTAKGKWSKSAKRDQDRNLRITASHQERLSLSVDWIGEYGLRFVLLRHYFNRPFG